MSRPKESARVKALKAVLEDDRATPADRVRAVELLDRMAERKARRRKKAAPLLDAITKPTAELDEETIKELERRGLDVNMPEMRCAAPGCTGPAGGNYVWDDKPYCWQHAPCFPYQRDIRRCTEPGCPNCPSHSKAGKPYCWRHYPTKELILK
jgi:hypothetical protein